MFGFVPSSCPDYSEKELLMHGENHHSGVHTIRFMTKKNKNHGSFFLNACYDGEHLFQVRQVMKEDLELLKGTLLKARDKA